MICIAFYLRSTLGGDIANKVHVGDAHANTTPRHSRTAVGAILLLIRLKTQDRRTQSSVKKRKHHKQIPMHTPWLGHTKKKSSQFHLTFSKRFQRTSIAWIIRAVLPFLISWCEIWSKTAMFFGPVDWALGTIYMVWDDEHCQKPTKIDGHPRIPSRLLQGFSHSLLLYNINSAIFCRYFHTSIIHKIW